MFKPSTKHQYRLAAISGLAVIGLAMSGCSATTDNAPADKAAGSLSPINLASQPNGAGLPMYLAQQLGYFKDEGLNAKITYYASGPASLTAGAAGEWDAGWQGAPPALTGANTFGLIPAGVMIQEDANHIMFMRTSVLDGKSPAQVLKDHKVATSQNSLAEQVMRACATHFGLDPADLQMVPLDGGGVVQALQSGQVDVANSWATPDFKLLNDPKYTQVCSGKTAGVKVLDPYVITPKFADAHPKEAAAFLRAVYRANAYINDNHDKAVDQLLKYYQENGVSGERDQAEYEITIRSWQTLDQAIDGIKSGATGKGLKASAAFFVKNGVYASAPPIDKLLKKGLTLLEAAKAGETK